LGHLQRIAEDLLLRVDSQTLRMAEVQNPGTPKETILPAEPVTAPYGGYIRIGFLSAVMQAPSSDAAPFYLLAQSLCR
jgi:hypothetical protein